MDFNQISSSGSDSKGGRLIGLVVAIVVVLVIVALFVILSRNNSLLQIGKDANSDGILTDEEKIQILEKLPEVENPLTDEEKIKILNSI